jgi:hypothetical protein
MLQMVHVTLTLDSEPEYLYFEAKLSAVLPEKWPILVAISPLIWSHNIPVFFLGGGFFFSSDGAHFPRVIRV